MRHVVSGVQRWWLVSHLARRASERARWRRSAEMLERNASILSKRGGRADLYCVAQAETILAELVQPHLRRRRVA